MSLYCMFVLESYSNKMYTTPKIWVRKNKMLHSSKSPILPKHFWKYNRPELLFKRFRRVQADQMNVVRPQSGQFCLDGSVSLSPEESVGLEETIRRFCVPYLLPYTSHQSKYV